MTNEIPLDDRGIEREAFLAAAAEQLNKVPIERLRGATFVWVAAEETGLQVREYRVGSNLSTNTALLKAFIDDTRQYQFKAELQDSLEQLLNGLINVLGDIRGGQP